MIIDVLRVTETVLFDKGEVRTTKDGYLVANPRVGRIGIQMYTGAELGKPDMKVVRVWRPEAEVMDKAAMATIAHSPITNDHPPDGVNASNWKKYSVGHTGDTVARDGDFIRVPMTLMDASAIKDFNDGKRELSLGYTSNLEWRQGSTPQGEPYDAVQTQIRVNHLAVVDTARGGPKLAIGDSAKLDSDTVKTIRQRIADGDFADEMDDVCVDTGADLFLLSNPELYPCSWDGTVYRAALVSIKADAARASQPEVVAECEALISMIDTATEEQQMAEKNEKLTTITVDGVPVEMTDIAASVVMRRLKGLETEASDLHSKLAAHAAKQKEDEAKQAEKDAMYKKKTDTDAATIATLQSQLKDAAMTPEKLDAMVKDRSEIAAKARFVIGDKLVVQGKTTGEIKKQVVQAKVGDASKTWSDDAVSASFDTLTAGINPVQLQQTVQAADALATGFSGVPQPGAGGGRSASYDNYDKRLKDAWKGPAANA
jgi:hypothetical protein